MLRFMYTKDTESERKMKRISRHREEGLEVETDEPDIMMEANADGLVLKLWNIHSQHQYFHGARRICGPSSCA